MGEVIDIGAEREARTPHWHGNVVCVGCGSEWEGVAPVGTMWVDCPGCGLPKGTPKNPFAASPGEPELTCACGCYAMNVYKRGGLSRVMCMGCGTDLTEAAFA